MSESLKIVSRIVSVIFCILKVGCAVGKVLRSIMQRLEMKTT